MTDDIAPEAIREVDTLLTAWALALVAGRSPDPEEFLATLDSMLSPLLRTKEGFTVLAHRLELARALLKAGRTDPQPHMPRLGVRRPRPGRR
jgi:hypothetical protein